MKREPLMTLAQVAEYLNVSTKSVRRVVAEGKLPAYRVTSGQRGSPLRFKPADVDALLRRIPTAGQDW